MKTSLILTILAIFLIGNIEIYGQDSIRLYPIEDFQYVEYETENAIITILYRDFVEAYKYPLEYDDEDDLRRSIDSDLYFLGDALREDMRLHIKIADFYDYFGGHNLAYSFSEYPIVSINKETYSELLFHNFLSADEMESMFWRMNSAIELLLFNGNARIFDKQEQDYVSTIKYDVCSEYDEESQWSRTYYYLPSRTLFFISNKNSVYADND